MKRTLVLSVFLLVSALLITACGGNDKADTIDALPATPSQAAADTATLAPTETLPTPTAVPISQIPASDRLQRALLTLDDMPSGWTVGTDDDDDDDDFCGRDGQFTDLSSVTGDATAIFQQSEYGPFLGQGIRSFQQSGAKDRFEAIRETVKSLYRLGRRGRLQLDGSATFLL
jgi:hypothetical protein